MLGKKKNWFINQDRLPPIERDGLVFWLDSEISKSYSGSGSTWTDLIGGLDCNIVDGAYNPTKKTIDFLNLEEYINVPSLLIRPNGGYTFMAFVELPTYNTNGNPGFWRYSGSFNIMQYNGGLNGAPWVRVNNSDDLKPTSGWVMPLNQYFLISYTVFDNNFIAVAENGVNKQVSATTQTQNDFIVNYLNYQFTTNQNMFGKYKNFIFYDKPLSEAQILSNYNILNDFYTF